MSENMLFKKVHLLKEFPSNSWNEQSLWNLLKLEVTVQLTGVQGVIDTNWAYCGKCGSCWRSRVKAGRCATVHEILRNAGIGRSSQPPMDFGGKQRAFGC